MSSGTGSATLQNSGIDWKDKLRCFLRDVRQPRKAVKELSAGIAVARADMRSFASLRMTVHLYEGSLLGSFFRRFDAQVLHHHLQVLPRFALLARIAQQECGVVSDGQARA